MIRISETFATGVWIGNPPGKSVNFRGDNIDLGQESRPEVSGFRPRPRPEVRDRSVLTQEEVGTKKSARGHVAPLLADLAPGATPTPNPPPKLTVSMRVRITTGPERGRQ